MKEIAGRMMSLTGLKGYREEIMSQQRSKLPYQNLPIYIIGVVCFFLLAIFIYRSSSLLFGGSTDALMQPKTCVEFRVFKQAGNEWEWLNKKESTAITIILDKDSPSVLSRKEDLIGIKNDCYYAKDVIALKESITQEESIAILAMFVPLFGLLMTVMSYYWVNTWKKEIKKIRRDSKLESVFFSKLLRRIEEVGARYSAYMMDEEVSDTSQNKGIHTAFDAIQAGREIENNLLSLSNNSNSRNGKINIALRSLAAYISVEDIKNRAPYLLPLRDALMLIESSSETSDEAKNSINHFIDFIEGNSASFNVQ